MKEMEEARPDWGGWRFERHVFADIDRPASALILSFDAGERGLHSVDVKDLVAAETIVWFIMYVRAQEWANDACLAGLVRALSDLLLL
jgi:hypothetical protein